MPSRCVHRLPLRFCLGTSTATRLFVSVGVKVFLAVSPLIVGTVTIVALMNRHEESDPLNECSYSFFLTGAEIISIHFFSRINSSQRKVLEGSITMDDFFRLNGSAFMRDYMTRLSAFLGESDLYCFARTCTLFYNALHERIPYNVRVSEDSFQSLDVLEFLQRERVIGAGVRYNRLKHYQKPHVLRDATSCVIHTEWMMRHLYCKPKKLMTFVVYHDCVEMVQPVIDFLTLLGKLNNDVRVPYSIIKSTRLLDVLQEKEVDIDLDQSVWESTDALRVFVLHWNTIIDTRAHFFYDDDAFNGLIENWLSLPKSNWKSMALSNCANFMGTDTCLLSKDVCDAMTCWERAHFIHEKCKCQNKSRHEVKPHARKRLKRA